MCAIKKTIAQLLDSLLYTDKITTVYTEIFARGKFFSNFSYGCCWQKNFPRIFSHSVAHCASIGPPITSWRVACELGEIEFLSQYKVRAIGEIFGRRKFPHIRHVICFIDVDYVVVGWLGMEFLIVQFESMEICSYWDNCKYALAVEAAQE